MIAIFANVHAGQPLSFEWLLRGCVESEPGTTTAPTTAEDPDPYGLAALEATWLPPAIGRVRDTADIERLAKGKFVVLLAPAPDSFTFDVEGQPLWLGRVSLSCLV